MGVIGLRKLCTPAYVYLVISLIALGIIVLQNVNNSNTFCMGEYSCNVSNIYFVLLIKIVFILFWTWILNLICKLGSPLMSWILVLFPLVLMFIFISMFMIYQTQTIPVNYT
jgi:hypothetical protein